MRLSRVIKGFLLITLSWGYSLAIAQPQSSSSTPIMLRPPNLSGVASSENEQVDGTKINQVQDGAWTINFKDADLQSFVQQIALITGDNYVFTVPLNGKVNISSQTPLKKDEIRELAKAVLQMYGYSIVGSGHILSIQPSEQAKRYKVPIDNTGKLGAQEFAATIIPIKYANVGDLVQAMQAFTSDHGIIKGFSEVNAILVADSDENIQKIRQLVATIDNPDNQAVDIIPLRETVVGNIMPLLEKLAPRELASSQKPGYSPIRIVADERSNVILVRGEEAERSRMRKLIQNLDKPMDPAGYTQVIYLQNSNAKDTADLLKDFIKTNPTDAAANTLSIKADPSINALIVRAPRSIMDEIQQVISQIDIQPPQVLIEAVIVEVTDDVNDSLGLQYGAADAATGGTLAAASLTSTTGGVNIANFVSSLNPHPDSALLSEGITGAFGKQNSFSVLIKALSSTTKANVLSTPHITTLDNMEAKIVVGQNVPFLTGSFTTTTAGVSNPFNTVEREDVGVTLKVTPQISANNSVRLKVDQEVSSIEPTTTNGAADIITNKRTISTTVMADTGDTIVLGGLISNNTAHNQSKIPILGDIPWLGLLFQSNTRTSSKQNLLIFLRPTILRNREEIKKVEARKLRGVWELSIGDDSTTVQTSAPILKNYYDPPFKPTPLPALPWMHTSSYSQPAEDASATPISSSAPVAIVPPPLRPVPAPSSAPAVSGVTPPASVAPVYSPAPATNSDASTLPWLKK